MSPTSSVDGLGGKLGWSIGWGELWRFYGLGMAMRLPISTTILRSADGEPVALHQWGGSGPPLLIGHGNGLNAGMWAAVVPYLVDHFTCFGIDLRGHGRSRPTAPGYSVARIDFANDLRAAVHEIGGAPIRYVGHSLGAASAIVACASYPELFSALWLFEPVLSPKTTQPRVKPTPLIESARRRRMVFDSVDDAFERFVSKPPFSQCDPSSVRAYVELGTRPLDDGTVRLSCEGEDEARVFGSGEPQDFDTYARITQPIVVACGTETEPHGHVARMAPLIADALGNATLERHDELTHFGPMEAPAQIAESILAHLAPTP